MDVEDLIKQFIMREMLNEEGNIPLENTTLLLDSGVVDSLGIMKLLAFLEETFSIRLGEDELIPENFESVDSISLLVTKRNVSGKDSYGFRTQ